ncbi:MAG TPA: hypothetical protein PLB55_13645 [Prosthecobacter sp.]|nr:hypothetical protein [Prosthecobacter sp.]
MLRIVVDRVVRIAGEFRDADVVGEVPMDAVLRADEPDAGIGKIGRTGGVCMPP